MSVVLVNVGPKGRIGEPELLPLDVPPLYQIVISDADADLDGLADAYPDAGRALVHYTVHWQPGTHNLEAIRQKVQAAFPRWYGYDHVAAQPDGKPPAPSADLLDVPNTVRDSLNSRLEDDSRRPELMTLCEDLLREGGWLS